MQLVVDRSWVWFRRVAAPGLALAVALFAAGCGNGAAATAPTATPLKISSTPVIQPSPTPFPTYVVPKGTPVPANLVAIRVNGSPIYLRDYERLHGNFKRVLWEQGHIDPESAQGKRDVAQQDLLIQSSLIQRVLLTPFAQAHGLLMSKAQLQQAIAVMGGKQRLDAKLAAQMMTMDDYRWQITQQNIYTYVVQRQTFKEDELVVRQIVLPTLAAAQDIRQKLLKGGDFTALAQANSIDASSKNRGGLLGFVTRGQLPPVLEQAAFSLKVSAFSEPIKAPGGYYILQVMKKTLNAPLIGQALSAAQSRYWANWYTAQRRAAHVEFLIKGL